MLRVLTWVAVLSALLLAAGCAPNDTGVLEGRVTIVRFVPDGQQQPTPTPDEFGAREIVIKSSNGLAEVGRANLDPAGNYSMVLLAGLYVVDINYAGGDRAEGLPKTIQVTVGEVTRLDVVIDTGTR